MDEKRSSALEAIMTNYLLRQSENNEKHFSYKDEKEYASAIINADFEKLKQMESRFSEEAGRGVMSRSTRKQAEYAVVSGLTLLTRYAIEGGVEETCCYALSDVILQELSITTDIDEMNLLYDAAREEFLRLIKKAKEEKKDGNLYVESVKDFVAKNVFNKITLEEISDYIGVHPVYLSRLFKNQTGKSITAYISEKKIEAACTMLKFSDDSISMIAEVLCLAPQSNFTRIFTKVMGISPAQYRREFKQNSAK